MRPMDKFVTDFGLRAAMQGDLDFNTPSWGRQFFYLGHYPLMAELVHVFGPETAVKYATEPIRIAARTGNLAFPLEILKSKLRKVGYSSEAVDKLTVGDFGPGLIIEDGCEDGFAHDGFEFQVRSGDKDLVSFLKHLVM